MLVLSPLQVNLCFAGAVVHGRLLMRISSAAGRRWADHCRSRPDLAVVPRRYTPILWPGVSKPTWGNPLWANVPCRGDN